MEGDLNEKTPQIHSYTFLHSKTILNLISSYK